MKVNKNLIKILIPVGLLVLLIAGTTVYFATSGNEAENTTPTQGMNGSLLPNATVDPTR